MTPTSIPAPVQASAPDLARRVALIVAGLTALVAHRFLSEPRLASLIIPLWTRLTRTARSFERLMARLAANRPPQPRLPRPHHLTQDTTRAASPLPTAHGWLIRALPQEAAAFAAQLEALLAEPAIADLLAACPAAARILRPLGRMLGLPAFAPKRRAPKPRPQVATPRATPPRVFKEPLHPDPTYRPSANWPRGPWPSRRPRPSWPAACPGRAKPA